jgi:hypothetical protein
VQDGPICYTVLMECEKNPLEASGRIYDDNIFTERDFDGLLTADIISDVILHSMSASLSASAKYKIDAEGFKSLETPFVAGVRCPKTAEYKLFEYPITRELDEQGVYKVRVSKRLVPQHDVAVLGMSHRYDADARLAYQTAIAAGHAPEKTMFEFLNRAIDEVLADGRSEIDRPSVLKVLAESGLQEKDRRS